jgi:hypothetical protein
VAKDVASIQWRGGIGRCKMIEEGEFKGKEGRSIVLVESVVKCVKWGACKNQ